MLETAIAFSLYDVHKEQYVISEDSTFIGMTQFCVYVIAMTVPQVCSQMAKGAYSTLSLALVILVKKSFKTIRETHHFKTLVNYSFHYLYNAESNQNLWGNADLNNLP